MINKPLPENLQPNSESLDESLLSHYTDSICRATQAILFFQDSHADDSTQVRKSTLLHVLNLCHVSPSSLLGRNCLSYMGLGPYPEERK